MNQIHTDVLTNFCQHLQRHLQEDVLQEVWAGLKVSSILTASNLEIIQVMLKIVIDLIVCRF